MSIKKNFLAMCLIGLVLVLGLSLWNSADAKSSADLENDIRVDTTKNADNYAELVEACKAAGTTIEATILENEDFYKKIYMRTNLCDTKHETFMEDQSISEKGSEEWEIHWNAFVKETIAAYKETEEFSILAKKITKSKELIRKGLTDVTKIKAMEQ